MQIRILPSIIVFIGSYLPLAMILMAQDFKYELINREICWDFVLSSSQCIIPFDNAAYSLSTFFICLACFSASLITLLSVRPEIPVDIVEARYIPSELMSYTLPYVVSFMSLDYRETGKFVGLMIFLSWMFWITYKSGQLILNPVFTAFGWRYYEVTYSHPQDDEQHHVRALSRHKLAPGRSFQTTIQDVYVFRTEEKGA